MNERRDADRQVRWPLVIDYKGRIVGSQEYGAGHIDSCEPPHIHHAHGPEHDRGVAVVGSSVYPQ